MSKIKTEYILFGLFIFAGFITLIIGIFLTINTRNQAGKVYTIGTITAIKPKNRNTPEKRERDVFVSYEVENQFYENKLNFYSNAYHTGDQVEIYYMKENPNKIGAKATETFVLLFPGMGLVIIITSGIGLTLSIRKKKSLSSKHP